MRSIEPPTLSEKLRACEARFRMIAENIRDVFFLVDADTRRVVYISPIYEEIWGRSCQSVYDDPESWIDAIHPEDREWARRNYEQGVVEGGMSFEFRVVRPDGSVRWILARDFPVRDEQGEVVGITGVAADITERKRIEQELQEHRQRLDSIVTSAMDAIVSVDDQQRIVLANAAVEKMFGYAPSELLGQPLSLLIPERFRAGHAGQVAAFGRSGETSRRMGALRSVSGMRRNGEEFPLEASISRNESTTGSFYTAILRDNTERQLAERRIERLNRVYAVLSAINSLIVRARRRDALFEQACRIAVDVGGYHIAWIGLVDRGAMKIEPVAMAGGDADFLASVRDAFPIGDDVPDGHTMVAQSVREGHALVSNQLHDDPRVRYARDRIAHGIASKAVLPFVVAGEAIGVFALYSREPGCFDDEEMRLLLESAGDISFAIDNIRKDEQLDYLAYYDPLTGLANQKMFVERLRQQILSGNGERNRIAIFVFDIERFRTINEAFGRKAGDELLRMVAVRCAGTENGQDARFSRLDADRFAIFSPDMGSVEQVGRYLERRLGETFDQPFRVADNDVRIAARVGVALFPDDGTEADVLLHRAEAALKRAKARAQGYLFFDQAMTERVAEHLSIESRLRQALENDEFVLHYQPKVSLLTGEVTGAEALIRWNDPKTGLVPPGMFIPILEETGLIHAVGRWAMRKALGDHLRWRNESRTGLRIAVNVSPLQLRDVGFGDEVARVFGIDARAAAGIELEITESVIMEEVRRNIDVLGAIRALGTTIAIDDFGTGFSSLSYLSKLPIDILKIDRAFVTEMTSGPDGMSLVSTIINLAHSLQLKVVAEGVETEEQQRLLKLLRCDQMQGYLFSKPVPVDVFEAKFLATDQRPR